jgi:hypothetical protein
VTDAIAALIPGATVRVKDVDKETTSVHVTDGARLYDTGAIVEDHYLLTFPRKVLRPSCAVPSTWDSERVRLF